VTVFGIAPSQPEIHRVGHCFNARRSPKKELEHVSNRNGAPTIWLVTMRPEVAELREMLQEETAEAAECAHTAAGWKRTMTSLAILYRHSLENLMLADQASERGDREAAIILSEMQGIIDDVIIRLEEILATSPTSACVHRQSTPSADGAPVSAHEWDIAEQLIALAPLLHGDWYHCHHALRLALSGRPWVSPNLLRPEPVVFS
jgi:hypothetical protein